MFGHQERLRDQSTCVHSSDLWVTDGGDWEGGAKTTAHHRRRPGHQEYRLPRILSTSVAVWMNEAGTGRRCSFDVDGRGLNDLKASASALTPRLQMSSLRTVADKPTQLLNIHAANTWPEIRPHPGERWKVFCAIFKHQLNEFYSLGTRYRLS